MTQQDVLEWLSVNECIIYKEREGEGGIYYSMRKGDSKKTVIVYPVKSGLYKPAAVKAICLQLEVQVPDYGMVED